MPSDTPTPPADPRDPLGQDLPVAAPDAEDAAARPGDGMDAPVAMPEAAVPQTPERGHLFWRVSAAIVILDQAVKAIVRSVVDLYESKTLVPGFVDLVHVRNEGVAFGLFNGLDLAYKWLFTTALALAALAGLVYYARHIRADEWYARLGLSMILGGACGNLIDRLTAGYVLDFVDVYYGTWHFWAFNVADASISIGAVFVFLDLLVRPHASRSV